MKPIKLVWSKKDTYTSMEDYWGGSPHRSYTNIFGVMFMHANEIFYCTNYNAFNRKFRLPSNVAPEFARLCNALSEALAVFAYFGVASQIEAGCVFVCIMNHNK